MPSDPRVSVTFGFDAAGLVDRLERAAERVEIERTFMRAVRARYVARAWRDGVLRARSGQV